MTATSARPASGRPQRPFGQWPTGERSVLPSVLGIPPPAAIGLAFGFTALGVFIDLQRIGTVGAVFQALYFSGCVLAMAWVRRRNLFAPLVQPPLLLAAAIPAIVLMGDGGDASSGGGQALLTVAAPLVNAFPTMAVTTGAVVALGVARFLLQRERRVREGVDRPARKPRRSRPEGATAAVRRPGRGQEGTGTSRPR